MTIYDPVLNNGTNKRSLLEVIWHTKNLLLRNVTSESLPKCQWQGIYVGKPSPRLAIVHPTGAPRARHTSAPPTCPSKYGYFQLNMRCCSLYAYLSLPISYSFLYAASDSLRE